MRQSALLEVRTERLVLRRPRLEDVPAIVLACQDPDVPRPLTRDGTPDRSAVAAVFEKYGMTLLGPQLTAD